MVYDVQPIFRDLEQSLSINETQAGFIRDYYMDSRFINIDIIEEKNDGSFEIYTTMKYLKSDRNLYAFGDYLKQKPTPKTFIVNENLLTRWSSVINVGYWEKDKELTDGFMNWIKKQDHSLWAVI